MRSERLAAQTAMVGLEEQSRDVGGASDADRRGQTLVNGAFSSRGTLAGRFSDNEERQVYRYLCAGLFAVVRNPYAYRLVELTPEGGACSLSSSTCC